APATSGLELPAGRPPPGGVWSPAPRNRGLGLPVGHRAQRDARSAAGGDEPTEEKIMKVQLVRRWGNRRPGAIVHVDERMGRWLLDRGWGVEAVESEPAPAVVEAEPVAAAPKPRTRRAPRRTRKAVEQDGAADAQ